MAMDGNGASSGGGWVAAGAPGHGAVADIHGQRLPEAADYDRRFADIHPPLDRHEARVEADRCYFCHDAPCMNACPTSIDIPLFIRQIQTDNPLGAARTIFDQNILGGMCARVCPTETLCEEACVREAAEGKPVKIGLLQRHATDAQMARTAATGQHPYRRAAPTGRRVAVVGAGPAGLACAHRVAMHGHDVTLIEARPRPGGLNEYGIAAYKTPGGFAQAEVDFILGIGGIDLRTGVMLGRDVTLAQLAADHDAVFLGLGLGAVNALSLAGDDADGVVDAVDWIAGLRQAVDKGAVPVGRRVVVIGGGMTAVDAAVQAKLLGADEVTIAYRRGAADMKASRYEQELAQTRGVVIRHFVAPRALERDAAGRLVAIVLASTAGGPDLRLPADQVMKAIGQAFEDTSVDGAGLTGAGGRIEADAAGRTANPKIWAGGDCVAGGQDLTVAATDDGRRAGDDIARVLAGH